MNQPESMDHGNNEQLEALSRELAAERELRLHYESLLKINPDTTLPIYREFLNDLQRIIELHEHTGQTPFFLVIIRLDEGYQAIKNTKDRSKAILFRTTIRIREAVGEGLYQSDRLDEFILLLRDANEPGELMKILKTVVHEVGLPHEWMSTRFSFGCHIGYAAYPEHGSRSQDLLGNAELAIRTAVRRRAPLVPYTAELGALWNRALTIDHALNAASQQGFPDFYMVYQPFVDASHKIRGCESLIRWKHPELGFIPPPQFIPMAERSGVIRLLGRWILYQSCRQLREWHQLGWTDLFVSVNLSPAQFLQKDLVQSIEDVLESTRIPGSALKLEITEGVLVHNPEMIIERLKVLRSKGIKLSIDDFGTGYSSLNYLRRLPFTTLKIDKSFVDHVDQNEQDQTMVRTIIALARSLGLDTLAEGVETREQRDFLWAQGCDYIQGYYYSKPVTPELFTGYLESGGELPLPEGQA